MDWVDLSAKVIPPEVINQIRAEDARRFKERRFETADQLRRRLQIAAPW
jgi:hypothetical protein